MEIPLFDEREEFEVPFMGTKVTIVTSATLVGETFAIVNRNTGEFATSTGKHGFIRFLPYPPWGRIDVDGEPRRT